ncbi:MULTISPECIES: restriction endonuclease PLD domain-containing protein [unclassified Sphingopyxis]|uniref:restriction endonuclease PLD domain-containing protein n=1 Tax=unclassified Sphingopyxis TaxID=2614943 RepID=UPI00286AF0DE|nr:MULTISPECIES: restriction endonuclease PLD domain-containing protein [unclassified Sphingopyxis]
MRFISHALPSDLDVILDSDKVHVVSPFLSEKTISRININRHKTFSLITRLPKSYNFPSAFIENDPKPLLDAMQRMGSKFRLYALPPVHAKIYINEASSWTGSANFTANGFSGKPEILVDFEQVHPELSRTFRTYLQQSTLITKQNLKALIGWIDEGLTEISRPGASKATQDEPEAAGASYESFLAWLRTYQGAHKRDAKVLLNRAEGGNQMSGHVAIAFNGVMSFLRKNPNLISNLLANTTGYPGTEVMQPLANFIRQHGDAYKGPRGGKWRSYLSTDLGGRQTGGGAGNVIVRRTLVLIPAYLRDRRA